MSEQPKYGIDGVYYIVGLVGGGCLLIAAGLSIALVTSGPMRTLAFVASLLGLLMLIPGFLGVRYVRRGKFELRDHLLGLIEWNGTERVLDIGTGGGLMAIGAAKLAKHGRVTGIDIWAADDLSNNSAVRARHNGLLEGVADRIDIVDGDARALNFPAATFDVIVSTLCLHNIGKSDQIRSAVYEIGRTLKPGGMAIISDLANTDDYVNWFHEQGLIVTGPLSMKNTFPPQHAVTARKPMDTTNNG